jgi:crotonobetainyl-CoA:carnitine CoA-transferase CaiB-like acyl-CoA transferase
VSKPLEGVKVVDLTRMIVGPAATMLLADMGADVVKIEPKSGDDTRYMQVRYDPERCPFFLALNRNKRGVVLDLTTEDGLDVFHRMVARADVVVHNFRPGIVEKLKIAFDDVVSIKPDIIYCSISAFGETGSYAKRPGTDILFQAMGGLMSVTGEPDGRSLRAGAPIIDVATGVSAAYAILAALIRRMRSGEGDYIAVSLFEQTVFLQSPMFSWSLMEGIDPPRLGNRSPMALILDLATSDGDLMVAIPTPKFWKIFCDTIGLPELAADQRFRTHPLRLKNQQAMMDLIEPRFRNETTRIWVERLLAQGVPCGPVRTYQQVLEDSQLAALGTFMPLDHEVAGRTKVVGLPFRLRSVPAEIERTPPTLGRDTEAVLSELGYDNAQIRALAAAGATVPQFLADR